MARPQLLVFDVNETLLDLSALRPAFVAAFGSTDAMGEWFARLLHGSLVSNHTNRYRPFGVIGVEALHMVASKRGIELKESQATEVVETMRRLPPHPDVAPALAALHADGFRMITLTNGSADAVADQVRNAALGEFFEATLSVDRVQRFKPAPEAYLTASIHADVEVDAMLMVAAHDWDILGARTIGMPGAFINRPGAVWSLPDALPDIVASDVGVLAGRLMGSSDVA